MMTASPLNRHITTCATRRLFNILLICVLLSHSYPWERRANYSNGLVQAMKQTGVKSNWWKNGQVGIA